MPTPPTPLQLKLVSLTSSGFNSETDRFDFVFFLNRLKAERGCVSGAEFWEKNTANLRFYSKKYQRDVDLKVLTELLERENEFRETTTYKVDMEPQRMMGKMKGG